MPTLSGLPYAELAFDRDARPVDPAQTQALLAASATPNTSNTPNAPTDLVVLAHGWNDDEAEARALYTELGANLAAALAANGVLSARRVSVAGVLWPSKRFADPALIPGGAAYIPAGGITTAIHTQLDRVEALTGADLARARRQVPRLPGSADARRTFVAQVLDVLPPTATEEEPQPAHLAAAADEDPQFLARLGAPVPPPPAPAYEPHGGAATLDDWLGGVVDGALNLLNYTTYYVMKDRAGRVGRDALAPVLAGLRGVAPQLRVHLVGHSFGARLVTAAAAGFPAAAGAPRATLDSLSLLQGAFSHYAFARGWDSSATRDGFFRAVVAAPAPIVRGPTLVTHTTNDHIVGLAYAIASRVAGQLANTIGGPRDPYGALGANGALKTPEAVDLRLAAHGEPYSFAPGVVYNLNASGPPGALGVISGHGDVRRPEVAHALAEAVRAAR